MILIIAALSGLVVALGAHLYDARKSRDEAWEQAAKFADQADDADARVAQTIIDVAPLLVRTDWTTGNYIGRLDYLRSQEEKRNEHVVRLRKVLMDSQVVKDEVAEAGLPMLGMRPLGATQ